jgi:hypothetical protein
MNKAVHKGFRSGAQIVVRRRQPAANPLIGKGAICGWKLDREAVAQGIT